MESSPKLDLLRKVAIVAMAISMLFSMPICIGMGTLRDNAKPSSEDACEAYDNVGGPNPPGCD